MAFEGFPPFHVLVDTIFVVAFCLYLFLFLVVALLWCFLPEEDTTGESTRSSKTVNSTTKTTTDRTDLTIANNETESTTPSVARRRRRQKQKRVSATTGSQLEHHASILASFWFGAQAMLLIYGLFCVLVGVKIKWQKSRRSVGNDILRSVVTEGQLGGSATESSESLRGVVEKEKGKAESQPEVAGQKERAPTRSEIWVSLLVLNIAAELLSVFRPSAVQVFFLLIGFFRAAQGLTWAVSSLRSDFPRSPKRRTKARNGSSRCQVTKVSQEGKNPSKEGTKDSKQDRKASKEGNSATSNPSTTSADSQNGTLRKRSSRVKRSEDNRSILKENSGDSTSSNSESDSSTSEEDDNPSQQRNTVKSAKKSKKHATCWDIAVSVFKAVARVPAAILYGEATTSSDSDRGSSTSEEDDSPSQQEKTIKLEKKPKKHATCWDIAVHIIKTVAMVPVVVFYGVAMAVGLVIYGIFTVITSESGSPPNQARCQPAKSVSNNSASSPPPNQARSQPAKPVANTPVPCPVTEREKRILQRVKRCPMDYEWERVGDRYRCKGGSHYVDSLTLETYTEQ